MEFVITDKRANRQSNFELLRLFSMLLVLVFHGYGVALGIPSKMDFQLSPASATARVMIESTSLICVNVFVLISGWFGIHPKLKSLTSFLFQCLFFSILISLVAHLLRVGDNLSLSDLGGMFFFGKYYYWFIKCYLCLYILSPILNSFVESAEKKIYLLVLIGFFIIQTLYGWTGTMPDFDRGYSVISFIGLYLLARYIKVYGGQLFRQNKWLDFATYLGLSLVIAAVYIVSVNWGMERIASHIFVFINPLAIISSVFFLLFFSKMNFQSKVINYLSRSAFAVYLFHLNSRVWDKFLDTCFALFNNSNGLKAFLLVFAFLIAVFLTAILIDQIRLLCWNPIKNKLQSQ